MAVTSGLRLKMALRADRDTWMTASWHSRAEASDAMAATRTAGRIMVMDGCVYVALVAGPAELLASSALFRDWQTEALYIYREK
jgi:uncharacterized metal-binding protein